MAYDNAVSALGKICQFHRDSIDYAQVLADFCSFTNSLEGFPRKFVLGGIDGGYI